MEKVIIIRYGEIFLKGRNKGYFENLLKKHITNSLKKYNCKILMARTRYIVEDFDEFELDDIVSTLTKIFGIHSISVAYKMKTDVYAVAKTIINELPSKGKFRVNAKRADKRIEMTSLEIASQIGGDLLELNSNLEVDLHTPDFAVNVDIRENGVTYVYFDTIKGLEGMPVGSAGKGMLLISGGIDSPVAGYRMAKRGMQINAIHFHSYPFTSLAAKQKVADLASIISEYCGHFHLLVMPFTKIQQAIHDYCREDFMITVMRMIMIEISERMAIKYGSGALITGESLGQVASQTLESITVTNSRVKELPVFRPLIDMDKTEIIEISKKIGAYETSILPYEDCCTVFLPKSPVIRPKVSVAEAEYNKIPNLQELIDECIENVEIIKITNEKINVME